MTTQPLTQTAPGLAASLEDGTAAGGRPAPPNELSLLGLVEALLKEPRRLDDLNRDESRQAELMPRFLAIALAGFALFGVALLMVLHFAPPEAYPHRLLQVPRAGLGDASGMA